MLSLHQLIQNSVLRAVVIVLLYIIIHPFHNLELVRGEITDEGFDIVNKFFVSKKSEKVATAPSLLVFGYDNAYMQEHHLFNEENQTNYGNFFHRSHLLAFVKELDNISANLKKYGKATPKALFLDFDLSFTLMPDGKTLSPQDSLFIEMLKKEHDFVIVLPKTRSENLVEQSQDATIQRLIAQKKIVFASVNFKVSKDNTVRRYAVSETFHNGKRQQTYLNANIVLWKLFQNKALSETELLKMFHSKDVVRGRILLKERGNWQNCKHYSVLEHLSKEGERISHREYENAIVMLGTTYTGNDDSFQVLNFMGSQEMTGLELHANTLMSLFFFDGQLVYLSFPLTLLLVFMVVFLVDSLVSLTFNMWQIKVSMWTRVISLGFVVLVMMLLSVCFLRFGYWFDWSAPTVLFDMMI